MSIAPVTLLFTDLVNSTELLERAGDEQTQRILRTHHLALQQAVAIHGGSEVKWLGDGLMSVFASPADAVRCAVAMQQVARRRVAGEQLAIRVGLNVGEPVREEADYFGTSVVVARRLCDEAEAGQILCSAVVAALLSGQRAFAFRDRGALVLKGLTDPVPACEVAYQAEHPAAFPTRTPFVGRTAELGRLRQRLQETRAGRGGLVMLVGEPGIGKTRLVEELADTARVERAVVLWGRCYEGEAARPYGPFVEAVSDYARRATPEALRTDLGLGAAPLARLAPVVRERLPDVPEAVALQPDEERVRVLDSVTQFLLAVGARAPVVLVLDDLHWADAGTIAMLRHVARFAARGRLLLLGAYRDVELDHNPGLVEALGALPRETTYDHLALAGLGHDEVGELLAAIADQDVPVALVTAIATETSGNPFFIREVLLHLVEEGKVFQQHGRWVSNRSIAAMGIPQSVRQVIQHRLARLGEPAQRLLGAASGFTGPFRLELAAEVAGIAEPVALDALDEILAAQLLRSAGAADTFDFTHALVRHTLYAQLSSPRQARLHRAIAEAMEGRYGARADEYADEIARHYYRSATLPGAERGVAYCLVAAERAEQSAAFAEAAEYLRIALELTDPSDPRRPRVLARLALALAWNLNLDGAEETAIRAAASIAEAEGEAAAAEFVADAADVMCIAFSTPRAWSLATHGLGYCGMRRDTTWARLMVYDIERREAADPEHPGIPVDSRERREVMARLWELPFRNSTQAQFAYMGFRSREDVLARAGNDPVALANWAGEYRRALPIFEREAAAALEHGQIARAIYHLTYMSRLQATLGDLEASQASYARAVELYERATDVPWLRAFLSSVLMIQVLITGEGWELILAALEAVLREGAPELQLAMAFVRCFAAQAAAQVGRSDDALRWLASVIPAIDRASGGSTVNYPALLQSAVSTLDALGCTDHAETLERNVRAKWLPPDFRAPFTDARVCLGLLCGLQRRFDEAAEWFAQARVVLDEQGARPHRARIDLYEARMYLRRGAAGDGERAARLLRAALEQFRAIGMPGWARRAEEMLAQLEQAGDSASPAELLVDAGQTAPSGAGSQPVPNGFVFRKEGDYWILSYQGASTRLKDAKGFHYLAHLLRHAGRELHVLDVVQGQSAGGSGPSAGARDRDAPRVTSETSHALLDAEAKAAYRRRLGELREELAEAESFNDRGRAERARAEIEALTEQLAAARGLGGRDRTSGSAAERARLTVGKGIKRALQRIAEAHPTLGEHLNVRVKTGIYCVYLVDTAPPIEWEL